MGSPTLSARETFAQLIVRSVATAVILMVAAVSVLLVQHHRLVALTGQLDPALAANRQILQSMTESQSAMRGYLLTGQQSFLRPYQLNRQTLADSFTDLADSGVDLGALPRQQQMAANAWLFTNTGPLIRKEQAPSTAALDAAALDAAETAFAKFQGINRTITQVLTASKTDLAASSSLTTGVAIGFVVLVSLIGAALLIIRGRQSLAIVGPPLEDMQGMLQARRIGDIGRRADEESGVHEVRAVAGAINEMIDAADRQRDRLGDELRLAEGIRQLGLTISARLDVEGILESAASELSIALRTHVVWMRAFSGEGSVPGVGHGIMYPPKPGFRTSRSFVDHAKHVAPLALARKTACVVSPEHPEQTGFIEASAGRKLLAAISASTGSESLLFVGVGAGVECLGYIGLTRAPGQSAWSGAERSAAVLAGQQIGQAILNSRMFAREQQLVDEMKALDERKNDFVSTVSHELRTPLASIMGYLELIRAGDLGEVPSGVDKSLGAIDRNSKRLQLLIEDLLLLSQVEDRPLHPESLDLGSVVTESVTERQASGHPRADDFELMTDGPAPILGEQRTLIRVVDNLIDNAVKFSPPGTPIAITVTVNEKEAVFTVQDHGIGISPSDRQQIFRRFYRSSEATNRALPGTGLGLSITKMIIDKHQGSIGVESEPGQGTTMSVRIPLNTGTGRRKPRSARLEHSS